MHELLIDTFVNPRCAQTDVDLRCIQVLRLDGFKGSNVGSKTGIVLRSCLGVSQLLAHVAGEVFICCHIPKRLVSLCRFWQREDHSGQFLREIFFRFSGQLRHVGHIHADTLGNRHSQRFHGGVHMVDGTLLLDGALGKHIRLTLELLLIVQHFQRTQEVVGRIIREGQCIATGIDEAILRGEGVVTLIEFCLQALNGAVTGFVQLCGNQFMHTIAQPYKALDALLGGLIKVGPHHDGVLAEVHLTVHDGI